MILPTNAGTTLDSPIFLHLAHPYALSRLRTAVEHVKRFHDQVAKLSTKGENSHIAKDFLMDITEGSGVDLQLLGPLLADILHDGKALNSEFRTSLMFRASSHLISTFAPYPLTRRAGPPAQPRGVLARARARAAHPQGRRQGVELEGGRPRAAVHQARGPLRRHLAPRALGARRHAGARARAQGRGRGRGEEERAVAEQARERVRALWRAVGRRARAQGRRRRCGGGPAQPVADLGEELAVALCVWRDVVLGYDNVFVARCGLFVVLSYRGFWGMLD